MTRRIIFILVLAGITLAGKTQSVRTKPTLTVGDPVPALDVQHWLKGTPVKQFEKGQLYVVEFWATWCAPCNAAMPHLSELARKYQDKVTIIGVSVWEDKKKPVPDLAAMQAFVNRKGKDMDYMAAMDNPAKGTVADTWLKAAGIGGIPATFVIDRNGKIVWIGHPSYLAPVLEAQVNAPGNFDLHQAREQHQKDFQRNFIFESAKLVRSLLEEKNYGQAWNEVQRFVKEYPDFEKENFSSFISAYINYDSKAAMAYILEKSKDGSSERLDEFARIAAVQPGLDPSVYYMAVGRLNKAIQQKPDIANLWSILAQAYAHLSEFDSAVSAQEKGITVFQDQQKSVQNDLQKMLNEKALERMKNLLATYNDLKEKKHFNNLKN